MVTVLRSKSFGKNLFSSIGGIFLLFAICVGIYQYGREKAYKIDVLHSRLQMYNYEMLHALGVEGLCNDSLFRHYTSTHIIDGIRVTVINREGRVVQDNYSHNVDSLPNHLSRHEVEQAIKYGSGYDIKRTSESTHETYFYSATMSGSMIVRTAVPYSAELTESLRVDKSYVYFTLALTFLLGLVLYWNTQRVSRHIRYLREFALKAEYGEPLDHELERRLPDDELGEISHTIITLYWKLRHSEEDKQRIKRQLTQNAAHELKTPAASIHGYLESILDNPTMDEEKKQHFLERCYAQSERMNKLLLDMSTLTKLDEIDSHGVSLNGNFSKINLLSLVKNVIDDTALQLQERKIEPIVSIDNDSDFMGDPHLVYSIFRNLVDNVIFYAIGATWLKIGCRKIVNDGVDFFEVTVRDNGQGVASQHIPNLFERFYRVDKGRSRKLGGTGLGLAIVKNAVVVHGGKVFAEPTPGGGLTIKLTLRA